MKDPVGQLIADKYRVTRRIGGGGVADVYEAVHERLNLPVAIKILRKEFGRLPTITQRFLSEGRAASAVKHPGIVQVFDVDRLDDGELYIVMELLQGEELSLVLEREYQFSSERAVGIALQMLDALEAAHTAGVVHRDMKPENVVLIAEGGKERVKLIDFGVARLSREHPGAMRRTAQGTLMGTPHYVSPEQARGETDVDHRTDIYSTGVVLFEMLTGEMPFSGNSVDDIVKKVIEAPFPSVRSLEPSVSVELEEVIQRATARRPADRYATAAEFASALRTVSPAHAAAPIVSGPVPGGSPSSPMFYERTTIPAPPAYAEKAVDSAESGVPVEREALFGPRPRHLSHTAEGVQVPKIQTVVVVPTRVWLLVILGVLVAAGAVGVVLYFLLREPGREAEAPRVAVPAPEAAPAQVVVVAPPADVAAPANVPVSPAEVGPVVAAADVGGGPPSSAVVDAGAGDGSAGAWAEVRLTRLPRGARISLDDEAVEATFRASIREEPHRLRVEAPGWKTWVRMVRITGDAVIPVDMERRAGGPAGGTDGGGGTSGTGEPRPLANPFANP